MIALSKIYDKDCIITVNGTHALTGEYIGFDSFAINFLGKLEKTWPGFSLEIEKFVSNKTDVCVFVKIIADKFKTRSIHHFVVKNELEVEFNIYDDSQVMATNMSSD
jgi:hypothetical protein